MDFSNIRSLFPVTTDRTYLYSGSIAPAARPVKEALDRWAGLWGSDPAYLYTHYREAWERLRLVYARLINADSSEIAITDNTTRASNLIVQMLNCPPGSNVVIDDFTYPSAVQPWLLPSRSHVEIRRVRARDMRIVLDDLAAAIDDRTVAVSISHVNPRSGFRHDVKAVSELAHAHNAYLVVDAAQSAGAIEVDVSDMGIDLMSCTAMKWLLGTAGIGFLFVSSGYVERLTPPQVGYMGVHRSPDRAVDDPLQFRPGAVRHELGVPMLPGLEATSAGIELLLEIGIDVVETRIRDLTAACIEGLLARNLRVHTSPQWEQRAGCVALPVSGGADIVSFMRERRIDLWSDYSGNVLRIDPHVYNNAEDIERCLVALATLAREREIQPGA